jgi:hypothetical protein
MDTARPILQAAANAIKEVNGNVNVLKKLVGEGKVSGEAFFNAVNLGLGEMAERAKSLPLTVGGALTAFRNQLTTMIGGADDVTGASKRIVDALNDITEGLNSTAFKHRSQLMIDEFKRMAKEWKSAASLIGDGLLALDRGIESGVSAAERRLGNATGGVLGITDEEVALLEAKATARNILINRMTGRDLIAGPAGPDERATGRPILSSTEPKTLAELGKPPIADDKESDRLAKEAQREAERVRELVDELRFESEIRGLTEEQMETARRLREAESDNIALSSEEYARLRGEIIAYTAAEFEAERATEALKEAQEQLNETMEAFGNIAFNALDSLIVQGESAKDVLANLLRTLASAGLQAAILGQGPFANILGLSGADGAAGGLTGLAGGLFGGTRASGGPVSPGQFYRVNESGQEFFAPNVAGRILPAGSRSSGGGETVVRLDLSPDVEARVISQTDSNTRVAIGRYDKQLPRRMPSLMTEAQARRM